MNKSIYCILFLCLPFSLFAQKEENQLSEHDSIAVKHDSLPLKSAFGKLQLSLKKFLNFSDFDTVYISPNRYNYAIMVTHFTGYEYYSIGSSTPKEQRINFTRNPLNKIGLYFGWRWIFLGWSIGIDDITRKTNKNNKGTEFELSLYSSKMGIDVFYRKTDNNYKIHKISGFSENIPTNFTANVNGLKMDMKGMNLYYIFNNRRFSYPAAFSQSTNQRRNAGSLIAGFSISTHNLSLDYTQLPGIIQESMNQNMKVEKIKYTNLNLNFGYAYNWVFARNYLACISLNPSITYKISRIDRIEKPSNNWYEKIKPDFLLRAGVIYNNSKYFVGASFVGRTFNYSENDFSLNNGFGTLQIYAGFNFHKRKQYRKK